MQRTFLLSMLFVGVLFANPAFAQQEAVADKPKEMTIGSTAPPIDIEHWVSTGNGKFEPFTEFEPGKVYVVEFWATWCGPCVASMPHLAATQEKYADQGVTIVSVSDEPLETVEKFLEREVMGGGAHAAAAEEGEEEESEPQTYGDLTSVYCLTTDPDGSVKTDFFLAAGQSGIPCAFIVGKDGVVEWIGHPMEMDGPLEQVVTDSWDREGFAKSFRAKQQMNKLFNTAFASARQGDYEAFDAAIAEIKKLDLPEDMAARVPMAIKQLEHIALTTMLTKDPERALAALQEKSADMELMQVVSMGAQLVQQTQQGQTAKPEVVDALIGLIEEKSATEEPAGPVFFTLAGLYHAKGDLDKAIELQQQAVDAPAPGSGARAAQYKAVMGAYLERLKSEKAAGEEQGSEDSAAEPNS